MQFNLQLFWHKSQRLTRYLVHLVKKIFIKPSPIPPSYYLKKILKAYKLLSFNSLQLFNYLWKL